MLLTIISTSIIAGGPENEIEIINESTWSKFNYIEFISYLQNRAERYYHIHEVNYLEVWKCFDDYYFALF